MIINTFRLRIAFVAIVTCTTFSCTQPTGLVNVVSSPAEDRAIETLRDDAAITLDINEALVGTKYADLFFEVSTDVYERVVMLTGTVKFRQNKYRATELVQSVTGVKKIVNALQVTSDYGPIKAANDLLIETKLKVRLLGADNIRSINFRWRAVKGVVYVIGAARTPDELARVLDIISKTKLVKKVINYAWVRPKKVL
mgnify:FL=1